MPLEALDVFGTNAPEYIIEEVSDFNPVPDTGAVRYRAELEPEVFLDAMVINKQSDILVVGFHGALNQEKAQLPRFERMSTIRGYEVSSMFFGDPSLWKSKDLQLSWYTGWDGVDVHRIVADWAVAVARAIGAKKIMFTGSSGGGFAALQISSLVPGSMALVFNAQTDIAQYRVNGEGYGPQRAYVNIVWPEIARSFTSNGDIQNPAWADAVGDRSSAVERYSSPTENHVFIVQNTEEFHNEDHYLPFLAAAERGENLGRVKTKTYLDGPMHAQPRAPMFIETLEEALTWAETLPPTFPERLDDMRISIIDASSNETHDGTISDAFASFAISLDIPAFEVEAKALRDLWLGGEGRGDEALLLCASLGVTVSQD
ncbi:hypothetical protein CGQ24_11850 [Arthrobacter sp. 7749]|nr:hypothetical protein CGQ24_11850 [Arthrobacter sp. 7749]